MIKFLQYRSEFKTNAIKGDNINSEFWNQCILDFQKYDVHYEKAAEFFVEHAERVKLFKVRYEILKLALEILESNSKDRKICDTVEMAMWKSCILAGPENIEIKSEETVYRNLKTELMSNVIGLQVNCAITEPDEKEKVEFLIGRLLDASKLETAIRISAIFNFRNRVSKQLNIVIIKNKIIKIYILIFLGFTSFNVMFEFG